MRISISCETFHYLTDRVNETDTTPQLTVS